MAKKNSDVSLWEQRKEPASPKRGLYYQQREQFFDALAEAKRLSLLKEANQQEYVLQNQMWTSNGYVTTELQVNFRTKDLKIAIRADGITHYYNLTESGNAVNVDELSTEEAEWPYLRDGIDATIRELTKKIVHQKRVKAERRRVRGVRLVVCAAVLAIITLGFFVLRWSIYEPREEANRERIAYNAGNHQLDGEGYEVDAHALTSLPNGALESIPFYGGDDKDLTHPRTISLSDYTSNEWCSDIEVNIPSGSNLVVATEANSLFVQDQYVAKYVDQILTVCLVDGFMNNEASEGVTAILALQVKPQGETS